MAGSVRFVSVALRASSLNDRVGAAIRETDIRFDTSQRFVGDE
jgi:hypothetical protein